MQKDKHMLYVNNAIVRCKITAAKLSNTLSDKLIRKVHTLTENNDGFGMNELLGIAAAIVIAAFIIIPGLQGIAEDIMDKLVEWWDNVEDVVFRK